jgi:hypothetical protein
MSTRQGEASGGPKLKLMLPGGFAVKFPYNTEPSPTKNGKVKKLP